MWSLVPRSIRRYRREHPYSNPFLFLCVDFLDSTLQIVIVCGVIYAGYNIVTRQNAEQTMAVAVDSNQTLEPIQGDIEAAIDSFQVIPAVIAASATTPTMNNNPAHVDQNHNQSTTQTRLLLDDKFGIRWVNSLPPGQYTIQFASSIDKAALVEFANDNLSRGAAIYPFKITDNNQPLFGVASGVYDSLYTALKVIDKFPEPLLQHGPWVRPVVELQREVSQAMASTIK